MTPPPLLMKLPFHNSLRELEPKALMEVVG